MSRTLSLVDALLLRGRRHLASAQYHTAGQVFTRLAAMRDLPKGIAEETQSRLAEIQFRRGKLRRTCRHLVAALQHDPDNASYHYRLARALHRRGKDNLDRAAQHYRRALELDPTRVPCLMAAGFLAIRMGNVQEGLGQLREATRLRPNSPAVLRRLVKGLRLAGTPDEARNELRAALFRNPRDPRFRQLNEAYQFRQLWLCQQKALRSEPTIPAEQPMILPFVPGPTPTERKKAASARILRHDGPASVPPPNTGTPRFPARHNG